jgi:hypothetical protein
MKPNKLYTIKGAFRAIRTDGYTLTIRQSIRFDFPVKFTRGCEIVIETTLDKNLIGASKLKTIKAL